MQRVKSYRSGFLNRGHKQRPLLNISAAILQIPKQS